MKKYFSISILAAIWMATCPFASAQTWFPPENMTNNAGIFDQKPSLDIGPAPNLSGEAVHIGYNRVDSKEIMYAVKAFNQQPPAWNFFQATNRTATNAPNSENWNAALKVFEPTGRVYIAYRGDVSGSDSEIFLTNNVNGAFTFNPVFVTANSTDDWEPALFIQGGSSYVAYAGAGGTGTPPADTDNEIWFDDAQAKSQVTVNSWHDRAPSLAVDANGNAHVAYHGIGGSGANTGDNEIWYAENTGGSWTLTQVTTNGVEDANPSLRLDRNGAVHISWQQRTESDWDIYYANNVSAPFPNIRVTAEATDEMTPSLAIDSSGHAHIAYQWTTGAPADEDVYYTHNKSGNFTSQMGAQTLVSVGQSTDNLFPSLDMDAAGNLHLSYQGFDGADTDVYYTTTRLATRVEQNPLAASPSAFYLHQNFPNPFNPTTVIHYSTPARAFVEIDIYDLNGAHLVQLVHESKDAGEHRVLWDGRAQNGQGAASGVYLARLRTGRVSRTIKMVKIQ